MIITVQKGEVEGRISTPTSKSMTHRALICSALAYGESRVYTPLISDDTEATFRVLNELGISFCKTKNLWIVEGGELWKPSSELFCGESGTTLRLVTALCSLVDGECTLTGGPTLSRRPVEPLLAGLRQLGVDCESTRGFPPVKVYGSGRIKSGKVEIRGDISSQFISALLLTTPLGDGTTYLDLTTHLESQPYVHMTIDVQRRFGVEVHASDDMRSFKVERQTYIPENIAIEGDWSSSSYMLAAGTLAGEVTVKNLNLESRQADKTIIEILYAMGADLRHKKQEVSVLKSEITGIERDMSNCPDLFPIVSALCSAAEGRSILSGLRRLRFKESDRLAAMVNGLKRMGIKLKQKNDQLELEGGTPRGAVVDSHEDHRIAMSFGILGLIADGETSILDAECVSKSYPTFWGDLERIGAQVRRVYSE